MIPALINRPATLHRWTRMDTRNDMGDYEHKFVDVPTHVELQQMNSETGSTEELRGRTVMITRWQAFLRPDVALSGLDELTVGGERYSFDGDPWLVRHPRTGRNTHWQARLKKVE